MTTRSQSIPLLQAAVIGIVAGLLAGLFGVGGGLIIVPLLVLWAKVPRRLAHGTSLAAVIPLAASGAIGYAIEDAVAVGPAVAVLAGAVVGAWAGARLIHSVQIEVLRHGFAALLFITAARLLWSANPQQLVHGSVEWVLLVALGLFAGLLSGLLGVGGGIVIVPGLILLAGTAPEIARGTSLAVIVGSSITGALTHHRAANLQRRTSLLIGAAGVPCAFLGVWLAGQLGADFAVRGFAALLLLTAWRMLRD